MNDANELAQDSKKQFDWRLLLPLCFTIIIVIIDQIIKTFIVANVPINSIFFDGFNGILRIIHQRNLGIALSIGSETSETFRIIFFRILPLIVLLAVVVYYFIGKDLNWFRRWSIAGILGGGFGNLVDRFFRPDGVVDFIDVKFFGIFGWERFPTFNIADASISVCAVLLFGSLLFGKRQSQ